jgi:hypothetical protein
MDGIRIVLFGFGFKRDHKSQTASNSFNFVSKSDIKNDDCILSLRRVGFYAGKAKLFENENNQSHYFIQCKTTEIRENLLTYLNHIVWNFEDTVGPRSISKQQFIHILNLFQKEENNKLKIEKNRK